ncbi:kinase phosphorylation protein-domain-containing protein [Phlyctochytrium arcticum]|nr:kinase phosphorylation protein-domain-containing protein [Phlyctochytrium arcticum]
MFSAVLRSGFHPGMCFWQLAPESQFSAPGQKLKRTWLCDIESQRSTPNRLNQLAKMFHHPTREGTRGGQGLFKWEDVKEDKYRENYLGHSVNAPVGRWQRNKDLYWYKKVGATDEPTPAEKLAAELEEIRANEAEALAEALGYAGPKRRRNEDTVSKKEIESLVKRDIVGGEEVEEPTNVEDMKGLGFQSTKSKLAGMSLEMVKEMNAEEIDTLPPPPASNESISESVPADASSKRISKSVKKSKKEKKDKKEKKKEKKLKKQLKREKHDGAESRDSGSEEGDGEVRKGRDEGRWTERRHEGDRRRERETSRSPERRRRDSSIARSPVRESRRTDDRAGSRPEYRYPERQYDDRRSTTRHRSRSRSRDRGHRRDRRSPSRSRSRSPPPPPDSRRYRR